jgi:hypothetical protein
MASDPLTPAATWDDVRTSVSGELGSAGALTASTIQPLTNRTHWLRQLLSYGLGAVGIDVASIRSRGISQFDNQCIFNGTFDMRGTTNYFGQDATTRIVHNACVYAPDGDRYLDSYELLSLTDAVTVRGEGSARTLIVLSLNGASRIIRLGTCPRPVTGSHGLVKYIVNGDATYNLTVEHQDEGVIITLGPRQRVRVIQTQSTWMVGG